MDSTFIQWLVQQTGAVAIAALALWLLDRSYRDSLRRERETIEQGRTDRAMLIAVIAENAKSHSSLQATIENMTRDWGRGKYAGSADD